MFLMGVEFHVDCLIIPDRFKSKNAFEHFIFTYLFVDIDKHMYMVGMSKGITK